MRKRWRSELSTSSHAPDIFALMYSTRLTPQYYLIPFSFLELLFFRHYWATPIGDTIPCLSTDHMGYSCKMAYIDLRQKLKIGFCLLFYIVVDVIFR